MDNLKVISYPSTLLILNSNAYFNNFILLGQFIHYIWTAEREFCMLYVCKAEDNI